jgi:hypothetical protein
VGRGEVGFKMEVVDVSTMNRRELSKWRGMKRQKLTSLP